MFKPSTETIQQILDRAIEKERDLPLQHVERHDAVPYIIALVKEHTATIKTQEHQIQCLSDHVRVLTETLNKRA